LDVEAQLVRLIVFLSIASVLTIVLLISLLATEQESTYLSTHSHIEEIQRVSAEARRAMDAAAREYLDEIYQQTKEMTNGHQE
jgi:hypothetical protein